MAKRSDDPDLVTIDHVGVALWRAAIEWRRRMRAEMAVRGYPWHLGARGEVLAHLGPSGRSQAVLTESMGLSKQAVQQLLDQLEADGVVRRVGDLHDKRAWRVELTELGLADYAEQTRVKRAIETEYRQLLGEPLFDSLIDALTRLASADPTNRP